MSLNVPAAVFTARAPYGYLMTRRIGGPLWCRPETSGVTAGETAPGDQEIEHLGQIGR